MNIMYEGKEVELKFTFNSFRYMQDLDLEDLQNLETTPFKVLGITETLMRGALNHNPRNKYSTIETVEIIEEVMEDGELIELLEFLLEELQESSFFKNLQEQKTLKGVKITKK